MTPSLRMAKADLRDPVTHPVTHPDLIPWTAAELLAEITRLWPELQALADPRQNDRANGQNPAYRALEAQIGRYARRYVALVGWSVERPPLVSRDTTAQRSARAKAAWQRRRRRLTTRGSDASR